MDLLTNRLLSLILFSPLAAAAVVMLLPGKSTKAIRWTALVASLVPLGLSIILWIGYSSSDGGFQFEETAVWYDAINSSYHLGVDGISVPMILLTTLLFPLGVLTFHV